MSWSEDCQNEIDRVLAQQDPKEVLAVCIANLIEAKIDSAFYNVGIGGNPSSDPMQAVDYNERLLAATLERFEIRTNSSLVDRIRDPADLPETEWN